MVVLVMVQSGDLIYSGGELTQCQLIIVVIRAALASLPSPVHDINASSLIRHGRCRLCNSLVTSHHADCILHVTVKVAQATELVIRISIFSRPINHYLNVMR